MRPFLFLFLLLAFIKPKTTHSQASFSIPDTVCINTSVIITNTSVGATTNYWNFCVADVSNTPPAGTNLGNPNGVLNIPVFMDYVQVNNNYFGFVVNLNTNRLVRLNFGNSLLNTPTAVNLGDFGGTIPLNAEGIQVLFNEGKWYAIIVGGAQSISTSPRIVKIDFGSDITNTNPIATNWGNVGGLTYPVDLHIFQENNNWFGLTVNAEDNTITRFNFSSSFNNTPTGVNLGNIGQLNYPTGIHAVNNNGNWSVFITNAGSGLSNSANSSLTRLDFGNSLLNTPTGINLGTLNNTLRSPRDLHILNFCDQLVGFISNYSAANDIVRVNFNSNIKSVPSAVSLGNIGNLNFPHSISKLFRVGPDLYGFVTNAVNNTITRLKFSGCNNSSIANSTLYTPPAINYSAPGTYNINLTVDEGLATQSVYCKQLVVVPQLSHSATKTLSICEGDSVLLTSNFSARNIWNTGASNPSLYVKVAGLYWVETTNGACSNRDSFLVSVKPAPFQVHLGNDTAICPNNFITLDAGNEGATYLWNTGSTSKTISINDAGNYYVSVNVNSCISTDTINISSLSKPNVTISNDTIVCKNSTIQLFSAGGTSYQWTPTSGMNNYTLQNPTITVSNNIKYYLTVTGLNSCTAIDSVLINVWEQPTYSISAQKSICLNDSVFIEASGGVNYSWQPTATMNNSNISNPKVAPQTTTEYSVEISDHCNNSRTLSTTITVLPRPQVKVSKSNGVDCITPTALLTAAGGIRYNWTPLSNIRGMNTNTAVVYPSANTWYTVEAFEENGCSAKDSILVLSSYVGNGNFFIPTAFTPNNDGKNDCFGIKYPGLVEIFELSIYNRWGQEVFRTKSSTECWDGKFNKTLQPASVFVYKLKVKSECTNGLIEKNGLVTLIR